jgi:hypothetical protein
LVAVIIAWIFLSLGLSRWIKKTAEKVRYTNIQNFIYTSFYFVFAFILTFPLNQCTPAEIRSVMGHELGHYVLNHIYKLIFFFLVLSFICFAFYNWAFSKEPRFKKRGIMKGNEGDRIPLTPAPHSSPP